MELRRRDCLHAHSFRCGFTAPVASETDYRQYSPRQTPAAFFAVFGKLFYRQEGVDHDRGRERADRIERRQRLLCLRANVDHVTHRLSNRTRTAPRAVFTPTAPLTRLPQTISLR